MIYLNAPEYERIGTETRRNATVVVYEPLPSFVKIENVGEQTAHVMNPSGEIVADAETGRLLSADVSYEISNAKSWGNYVLDGATGNSAHIRVAYEHQSNVSTTPVNTDRL